MLIKRVAIAGAASLLTAGCSRGILDPVGPVGSAEKQIMINSTAIMLAIIIPTMIATIAFAWWFRRGNKKATYRPDWEYSGAIEMVVWAIPALTVMLLGGIAWIGAHDLEPSKPLKSAAQPLKVDVVSLDWKWLFIYPDQGVATVNQLVVPAGAPVTFRLTSATVWNSFFVPQLGTMIYTMPGMTTRLNLQADKPGDYEGLSSHFSGDGFPGMKFAVHALPRRPVRDVGAGRARRRVVARRARLCRAVQAQQLCEADDLRSRRAGTVRRDRDAAAVARQPSAQPADLGSGSQGCSVSSAGPRSRSTSRSR